MSQPEKKEKVIVSVLKHVDSLKPTGIAMDPGVKNQFVTKFTQMNPQLGRDYAERYYARESDAFTRIILGSDKLRQCTPRSLYFALMKGAALKLPFDNGRQPMLYLIPGKRKVGDNEVWEVVAQPSPDGEKEVRLNSGILKEVGHPYIVHKGDIFEESFDITTGEMAITKFMPQNKYAEILASFIRLVNPDGKVVYKIFKPSDWMRWMAASTKKNWGKTNPLYTSGIDGQIDESFLKSKTLLHSFKGYKQIDYIYALPEGFTADKEAASQINPNYMDDVIDVDYVDETVHHDEPQDEFTQQVNEPAAIQPSVQFEQKDDDDDMFNAK